MKYCIDYQDEHGVWHYSALRGSLKAMADAAEEVVLPSIRVKKVVIRRCAL